MEKATIFKNNRNQAVRLPKAVAFPEHIKQVEVISIGDTRILTPIGKRWELWMNTPSQLTEDCFQEREQPIVQERKSF